MNWRNVGLIYFREMRDQLRDRRTMFMVAVLPLLLYPLLGFNWAHMAQLMETEEPRVLIAGADFVPRQPTPWFDETDAANRGAQAVRRSSVRWTIQSTPVTRDQARELLGNGVDAIVNIPSELKSRDAEAVGSEGAWEVLFDGGRQRSIQASRESAREVARWREQLTRAWLADQPVALRALEPFAWEFSNLADESVAGAALWSKILPFVLLIWALTGAFYPAVDLCAGEKERGTLETLLCSPAQRSEIVWGKLLTIMTFSAATSLLNLACMSFTGLFIVRQMEASGSAFQLPAPPLAALGWLVLCVIPIAALFSALALAIAAFARSTREGQYYLMPLLLINMPMMMLPLTMDLSWGTSLAPVAGLLLLLKALLEGNYADVLLHFPVVAGVTLVCCWMAVRWAESQFQKESVLFRESERWNWDDWLRRLTVPHQATPTAAEALFFGALLLTMRFFASMGARAPDDWSGFVVMTAITQLGLIAAPPLLMTLVLRHRPADTLGLRRPRMAALGGCVLLAVALHPLVSTMSAFWQYLYPLSDAMRSQLLPLAEMLNQAPWWQVVLALALAPAICEELAFRGFLLSGLRKLGDWPAIMISSAIFGLAHGILQQSLSAALLGVVLGYIVVRSRSIFPAIAFHFTHNALTTALARGDQWIPSSLRHLTPLQSPWHTYHWTIVAAGVLVAWLVATRIFKEDSEQPHSDAAFGPFAPVAVIRDQAAPRLSALP